jgi:hypothetical protein
MMMNHNGAQRAIGNVASKVVVEINPSKFEIVHTLEI